MIGGVHLSRRTKLGGGAAGPFSPASVAGLQAWFDAPSLALADAAAVSSFTDASGNGRHATQATGSKQPTYQTAEQNGLAVVRFDGVDDNLDTTTFARAQPQTTFVVWKALNNAQANITVFDAVGAVNTGRLYRQPAAGTPNMRAYAGAALQSSFTPFDGVFGIMATIWSGAASKQWANGGVGDTGNPGAPQGTGVRLGAFGGGTAGGFGNIDIGEFFVYNSALSLVDINLLGAYLGGRWGITWATAT